MAYTLVGTIGATATGTGGTIVSPAWGAGESRTAGNLLVCWVSCGASATLVTTPAGWSVGFRQAGTSCSAAVFYKIAAGADTAPVIAAITSATLSAQLAEFAGGAATSPADQSGGNATTSGAMTIVTGGADAAAGELVVGCNSAKYSLNAVHTLTDSLNNGATATATNNNAASTQPHYDFFYAITTANSSADQNSFTLGATNLTGAASALVSFLLPSVPVDAGAAALTATAALTAAATAGQVASVTLAASATLTAGAVDTAPDAATLTATASLATSGTALEVAAVALAAGTLLTVGAGATAFGAVALAAHTGLVVAGSTIGPAVPDKTVTTQPRTIAAAATVRAFAVAAQPHPTVVEAPPI